MGCDPETAYKAINIQVIVLGANTRTLQEQLAVGHWVKQESLLRDQENVEVKKRSPLVVHFLRSVMH